MRDRQLPAGHWLLAGAAAVLVLAFHALIAIVNGVDPSVHALVDTDSYMWLNRVLHLAGDGAWYDSVYPRINPPEGHVQHWTRPVDAVLLAGGWLLGQFVGFSEGLYLFAFGSPPVLHALTIVVLAWGALPLLRSAVIDRSHAPLLALVVLVQIPLYQPFFAGRPDHHAPLAFLFAVHLVLWTSLMLGTSRWKHSAVLLGATNALALWINPEALIYIALGMGGFLLAWIRNSSDSSSAEFSRYGLGLFVCVLLSAFAEWGSGLWGARWMDVLSLPHVWLFAVVAGFWAALHWLDGRLRGRAARWTAALSGSVLTLLAVLLPFPEFLGDPLAATDPEYRATRLERISELQPLWSPVTPWLDNIAVLFVMAGPGVAALLYATQQALVQRKSRSGSMYLVLATLLLVYLILALFQRRWTDYLALATVLPIAILVSHALRWVTTRFQGVRLRIVRPPATLALLVGHLIVGLPLSYLSPERPPSESTQQLIQAWYASDPERSIERDADGFSEVPGCDLRSVSQILGERTRFPMPKLVLAHTDSGPELVYRTHHSVLSIPNHRFQPGYHLMRAVFNAEDGSQAVRLLQDRGVDVVVLCLQDVTTGFIGVEADSFAQQLVAGWAPQGLELYADDQGFRIYLVSGT